MFVEGQSKLTEIEFILVYRFQGTWEILSEVILTPPGTVYLSILFEFSFLFFRFLL